MVDSRVRPT